MNTERRFAAWDHAATRRDVTRTGLPPLPEWEEPPAGCEGPLVPTAYCPLGLGETLRDAAAGDPWPTAPRRVPPSDEPHTAAEADYEAGSGSVTAALGALWVLYHVLARVPLLIVPVVLAAAWVGRREADGQAAAWQAAWERACEEREE